MNPLQLSHQLREESDPDLTRRRWAVGLSLFGAGVGQFVGLYQTGIIGRMPDLPVDPVDSNKVNASGYAYSRMQTPDALLMLVNYGLTACLAAAGPRDRARTRPWLPIAAAAKAVVDTVVCFKLAAEEWDENKAICAYCQAATAASLATAALAIPEAITAFHHLTGDGRQQADESAPAADRFGPAMERARQFAMPPADRPATAV